MSKPYKPLEAALLSLVQRTDAGAAEVTEWVEEEISTGFCNTCFDCWTQVTITYLRTDGTVGTLTYEGDLRDFLGELLND